MSKKQQKRETFPGLEYSRLKTAVEALVDLCNDGTFLRFLSPQKGLRLLGDLEQFRDRFADKLKDEIEKQEARLALLEINNYLATWVYVRDLEGMLGFLESEVFAEVFQELSLDGKKRFRQQLEDKTKLVVDKLFPDSTRQRIRQLSTAVDACIEDLDVEVVSDRRDQWQGKHVAHPFLRLRLRYSEGGKPSTTQVTFPGGREFTVPEAKAFEFECDETDIDLLQRRLREAKDLLLRETTREVHENRGST